MRILRVLARAALTLLLLLLLLALGVSAYFYFSTRVQTSGTLRFPGLSSAVTVTRDTHGIPHIKASSDEDAIYALGFVHAQDRMWQMEFQRRIGAGRLSEVLGVGALEQDQFLRTWGFYRAAQADLPGLSERSRRLLGAYSAGVNARIAQGNLPLEFTVLGFRPEPWTPTDSLVWQKMMAFDLNDTWKTERDNALLDAKLGRSARQTLQKNAPDDGPTILSSADLKQSGLLEPSPLARSAALPPQALEALAGISSPLDDLGFKVLEGKGSNSWVVSGKLTQSGKPILADDPHLNLGSPSLWYLASLEGSTLKVVGATIPGLPAVVIGRNARISWGVTNFENDAQDLFIEPDASVLTSREEVIKVKGQPDVKITVRSSPRGPIISDLASTSLAGVTSTRAALALAWPPLQPGDTTLDAFLGINYAQTWSEFREAMRPYVGPSQNFIYADVEGNIGYFAPGRMPIRQGSDGTLPTSSAKARWSGFVPFEQLPQVYNPPEGYLVTANHKPVPQGYPYDLGDTWSAPWRAKRILERLGELSSGERKITAQDMRDLQLDVKSGIWDLFRAQMLSVTPSRSSPRGFNAQNVQLAQQALERLRAWDGTQREDSVASSIFAMWYREISRMPRDELNDAFWGDYWNNPYFLSQQLETNGAFCKAPGIEDCKALLERGLEVAVEQLRARFGSDISGWQWGKLHHVEMRHGALNTVGTLREVWTRSSATPGGMYTVNVAGYDQNTFTQTHGPGYRQVVDLADPDSSRFMGSLGQSGNPLSFRYSALLQPWRRGETLPMNFGDGSGQVLTLEPR